MYVLYIIKETMLISIVIFVEILRFLFGLMQCLGEPALGHA